MASKKDGHPPAGEVAHLVPGKDLRRLVSSGANLLVRGEKSAAAATVVALTADFPPPLLAWNAASGNGLPAFDCGTLVIHDVDSLDLASQRVLVTWLEHRASRVRVISTVTRDLFPMVQAGNFIDQLYYRLNTIVIDAVGDAQASLRFVIASGVPGPHRF